MDFLFILNEDLNAGFSKANLEFLIGLPRNSLCGILKGKKNLSKKSKFRIKAWSESEKPSPFSEINKPKILPKPPRVKKEDKKSQITELEGIINIPKEIYKENNKQGSEPVRMQGEDVFDFAVRKNEWKLKNNK